LAFYRRQGKWLLFAYCLMPDHLHLLVTPEGGADLSIVLGQYESFVTRSAWGHGIVGTLWHRSFYDHILRKQEAATDVVAYILNNPVRAGLVEQWEDWPWCGMPDAL
jgi:putative transposase